MVAPRSLLLGAACFIAGCLARSSTGDRVLVVLDSDIQKSDYTQFWSSLECELLSNSEVFVCHAESQPAVTT